MASRDWNRSSVDWVASRKAGAFVLSLKPKRPKKPQRYRVPASPTPLEIQQLWARVQATERTYANLCAVCRNATALHAPKLLRRLRLARSSAAGAVRAAHGRYIRAMMNQERAQRAQAIAAMGAQAFAVQAEVDRHGD